MGKSFWEDNLQESISSGAKIGKSEHGAKQEINYSMVSIYENLEVHDRAYDFKLSKLQDMHDCIYQRFRI